MDVFKDAWEREVRILTDAVDDITTIDDFLAVSGMLNFKKQVYQFMFKSQLKLNGKICENWQMKLN